MSVQIEIGPIGRTGIAVRAGRDGAYGLFTTAAAGNLSLAAGACHEDSSSRRERLCATLGLRWLCAGPQVHGTEVARLWCCEQVGGGPRERPADGYATALCGVGTMVLAADCVPVLLFAPGAVAALHAGWRGLAAGVLAEGVAALREVGGEGEIVAAIGPCAGACCYEVGAEVRGAFEADGAGRANRSAERIDLRAIAHERLARAGVREVADVEACTICDERFFSHRREGEAAGRQAGIAWLAR